MSHEQIKLQALEYQHSDFSNVSPDQEANELHESSLQLIQVYEAQGVPIEDKEGIATSLDSIRSEFEIDDTAFEEPRTALTLTAIADRLNRAEKSEIPHANKVAELEYIADLVMLTVGDRTAYKDHYLENNNENAVSDERVRGAYDKFTQPEVTKDMEDFIHGEALDDLRQSLGIDEEEPFDVRVLSIGADSYLTSGLAPDADYGGNNATTEEINKGVEQYAKQKDYFAGLAKNEETLNTMMGREGSFAPAWVTYVDGAKTLCLALPTAEKIMYRGEERSKSYTDGDWERDLALLKHEYTHTQKMVVNDGHIGIGIALEELRAEHFSGDKHGYTDIKKFFMAMRAAYGHSPKDSFELDGKPFDEEAFFTDVATNMGLEGLLDTLTAIPGNYAEDEHASRYVKAVVAHNGGSLDAQLQGIFNRVKAKDPTGFEQRLDGMVDKLRENFKGNEYVTVESWGYYGGLTALGNLITENFRRRYPEESDNFDYNK